EGVARSDLDGERGGGGTVDRFGGGDPQLPARLDDGPGEAVPRDQLVDRGTRLAGDREERVARLDGPGGGAHGARGQGEDGAGSDGRPAEAVGRHEAFDGGFVALGDRREGFAGADRYGLSRGGVRRGRRDEKEKKTSGTHRRAV